MEGRLKQFVRLVDAGSFVRASRELHISQPALSVAIAKLERELHAPLLVHGVRPLTLTPAGKLAYATGKEMLLTADNLQTQLAELEGKPIAVSVGMIDSIAGALLASPQTINQLEQQALVSLVIDNSRNLLQATADGKLDLAFVAAQQQYAATLEYSPVGAEPLVLVCHPKQAAAYSQSLHNGTLPRFISYDQASTTYHLIRSTLAERGVVVDATLYSTSPDVMLRLVLLQKGVAALPYLFVREHIAAKRLDVLAGPDLLIERHIYATRRRGAVLPRALEHTAGHVSGLLTDVQTAAQGLYG